MDFTNLAKNTAKKTANLSATGVMVAADTAKFGLKCTNSLLSGVNNLANEFAPSPKMTEWSKVAMDVTNKGIDAVSYAAKQVKSYTK